MLALQERQKQEENAVLALQERQHQEHNAVLALQERQDEGHNAVIALQERQRQRSILRTEAQDGTPRLSTQHADSMESQSKLLQHTESLEQQIEILRKEKQIADEHEKDFRAMQQQVQSCRSEMLDF